MERSVVLEVVKHTPPTNATKRSDGFLDLILDLRPVFHHGHIDVHGCPPPPGTNPYLDVYANLLAPETDLLKWKPQGIARGDHKNTKSMELGRMFARAYLSLHGYRWFGDIKELMKAPENGWAVQRGNAPTGVSMPDWIVSGDPAGRHAAAEAKGTHSAISAKSAVIGKKWRPQVTNVRATKDGTSVALKSWIVATRWVTTEQPRTLPKMYAEDPDIPAERELTPDEKASFSVWVARMHTTRNLLRLGQYRVAHESWGTRTCGGLCRRRGRPPGLAEQPASRTSSSSVDLWAGHRCLFGTTRNRGSIVRCSAGGSPRFVGGSAFKEPCSRASWTLSGLTASPCPS